MQALRRLKFLFVALRHGKRFHNMLPYEYTFFFSEPINFGLRLVKKV